MSRYNLYSKQKDNGNLLTVECEIVENKNGTFLIMRKLNAKGKVVDIEMEQIK